METQDISKNRGPTDYLKIFFRRKWLFITPAFVGLVLGIVACFLIPPTWESSAMILVEEERIINPLIQNLAVSTTAVQRMQSIRELVLGWSSLDELTRKLKLDAAVQTQPEYETLILNLRKDIIVQMQQPNIIKIAYRGKDPQTTHLVAKNITDILMQKNTETQSKETDIAINFIKEQLAIYKRKIKESEIAQIEEQLRNLLLDSTEMHPMVKELRHKVDVARKELESGEYQVSGANQAVTEATREVLKKELDRLAAPGDNPSGAAAGGLNNNQSLYRILLMDKVDNVVARDINVNENIYNMLLQRLETARITQRLEASRQGTRYTVIDPPRLPFKPVKPNKIIVALAGLIIGLGSGVGLVLGRDFMDNSIVDLEDAKQTLQYPVLGGISRITTQAEIEQEKGKLKKAIIITLSGSAILIFITLFTYLLKR